MGWLNLYWRLERYEAVAEEEARDSMARDSMVVHCSGLQVNVAPVE